MAQITLGGTPTNTSGDLPAIGTALGDYEFTKHDMSPLSLASLKGKQVVLNIFPSVDTGVCATSVRTFNQKAAALTEVKNQAGMMALQIAEKIIKKELAGDKAQETFANSLIDEIKLN